MFRSYAIQHIGRLVVVVVAFPTESKCFAHKITYILQMNSFSAESTGDVMVIASEKKLTVWWLRWIIFAFSSLRPPPPFSMCFFQFFLSRKTFCYRCHCNFFQFNVWICFFLGVHIKQPVTHLTNQLNYHLAKHHTYLKSFIDIEMWIHFEPIRRMTSTTTMLMKQNKKSQMKRSAVIIIIHVNKSAVDTLCV